jgi:hypothetical protein
MKNGLKTLGKWVPETRESTGYSQAIGYYPAFDWPGGKRRF